MSLTPGSRVGSFEVSAKLGEGGMGAVYRAHDTKLNRDVAIKVLLPEVAGDADRVARFRREAQVLAALNHPNIAHIHGLEDADGMVALVLELVEGPTLANRIAQGPIPFDEALPIAKQIAEALEAAHEQGIIHRDLKPANIKVRDDGTVKVLDFGLAKALDPIAGSSSNLSNSPTITTPAMTLAGMILGTAAYMSPEQAKGRLVDRRADVWAFGAVLYEMLTGQRAFDGDGISDTLANVLKAEPDWSTLPADVPPRVQRALRSCLQKNPKQRFGDVQSVRLALDGTFDPTPMRIDAPAANRSLSWSLVAAVGVTAAMIGGLITGAVAWRLRAPPAPAIVRFPFVLPDDQPLTRAPSIALSPDGTLIAFTANQQIYVRPMNEMTSRPVPGTNLDPFRPFFSPDGKWLGFYAFQDSTLKKVALSGGSPVTICKTTGINPYGASWYGDQIVFADPTKGIMRVSADGGEPGVIAATTLPEVPEGPRMLDDDTLLFTTTAESGPDRWDKGQVVVQSIRSGERKVVLRGGTANFVAADHLVYSVGSTLLAVVFDMKAHEVRGGPVPVLEGVRRAGLPASQSGIAGLAVSTTGALVYFPGVAAGIRPATLARVDRTGRVEPLSLPAQPYEHPRVSPSGDRVAVATNDGTTANIWIVDLTSGGPPRRLTFGGRNLYPIWTPDGRSITFQSDREGDRGIFQQLADGSGAAERLTRADRAAAHAPESWTPDGKTLAFRVGNGVFQMSIWTLTAGETAPKRFDDSITEGHFASSFSPDGRWLAYGSSEGSRGLKVFVQPFPRTGAKYQLSTDVSSSPRWSPDGKQIIYDDGSNTGRLMAIDVSTSPAFGFGNPTPIPTPGIDKPTPFWRPYDMMPDGKHILIVSMPQAEPKEVAPRTQINVILNWFEELRARVPLATSAK